MLREFEQMLEARDELRKWGEAYEKAKANGGANPKIIMYDGGVRVGFNSDKGSFEEEPRGLISKSLSALVTQDQESLLDKAFCKAMADISDEIEKRKHEAQKLLDSI